MQTFVSIDSTSNRIFSLFRSICRGISATQLNNELEAKIHLQMMVKQSNLIRIYLKIQRENLKSPHQK